MKPIFEEFVARHGLADRLTFYAGDFFSDRLPEADVDHHGPHPARLGSGDEADLIAKAFRRAPQGGALIVYEAIIDDDRRENAFGLLMSLNMLIETKGGFDYTGADCQAGCRKPVFATRVEPLAGPDSMVIGIK